MTHGRMLSSPFGPSQPCAAGTMAAADFSLRLVYSVTRRLPFRSETRSPQVSPLTVPARAPDLRNGPLVARASRSIARSLWSAPPSIRFLFVAPRVSLAASFGVSLTIHALRFARVAATNSPEDFHLQVSVHAGHTMTTPASLRCRRCVQWRRGDSNPGPKLDRPQLLRAYLIVQGLRELADEPPIPGQAFKLSPDARRRCAGLSRYCDTHDAASGRLHHGQVQ
jgi:hypothetical protein